jgi:hypothetical protein
MARVKIQITTPSNNVIKVSPGVSALSSVQLYLNELIDVNTQHGADGYVLTQQADGTFAMEAVATTLADLSDTNILNPQGGDSLVYDANAQKWVPGGVKSVNGQDGDVVITIPSPPPTPGVSGLADTNITNLQDNQIIRYDSVSGDWLNEDLEALPSGGTTGQALVKSSNTDYDVTWDDIAVDVQFHQRYATEAETLRSGATETVELYFFAQGDGNGLAESASSDTPTSGYDIQRKLYYAEKAQADPNTSGDWTQFTAIADNTTFANAKAALLAYLKERTGGTVPISLKMTWEEVAQAPAFTGLLNESYGSGAEAAYSTRRLNGNVTDCMVIRRASDSTTTTIGFVDGDIDEAAITTFCTGTTCTVVTWKDQSGNGNDATAAAPANEPTIYTGGALVKEDGRVAIEFDGNNDYLDAGAGFDLSTLTMSTVQSAVDNVVNNNAYVAIALQDTDNNIGVRQQIKRSGPTALRSRFNNTNIDLEVNTLYKKLLFTTLYNGTNGFSYFDGSNEQTALASLSSTISLPLTIGQTKASTSIYKGKIQEALLFNSSKSTSDRTSIEENVGDYYTQNTPLLDTYSGAAAAYSLRKLSSSYTGPAIEVYAGTNGTADIYFNVFGELDTVALAAHCGNQDGTVRTWYDQSGNGNHATQTVSTANQPKIYDGTTGVVTEGTKPAMTFDLADNFSTGVEVNLRAFFHVGKATAATRLRFVGSSLEWVRWWTATDLKLQNNANMTLTGQDRLAYNLVFAANNTTSQLAVNGGTATTATGLETDSITLNISLSDASSWQGTMQEIVIYESDQSSNRTNIESNINTFYSIY